MVPIVRRFFSKRGSSLIGSLFAISLMAMAGMSLLEFSSEESVSSVNSMQREQSLYVGHAGLEYAKGRLDQGQMPDVVDQPFDTGSFTIVSDPSTRLVTVDSEVGIARAAQSINADFSKDCVTLDVSTAYADGANLRNVKLVKTCNAAATVAKMWIDWNWPQCGLQQGDTVDYGDYADPDHPGKIFICHLPNCDESKANTLSVSISEWETGGHSAHECDYLGECGADGGSGTDDGSTSDPAPGDCDDADHDGDHDHQGGLISGVGFNGQTIYDPASGIGSPYPASAGPTEEIDVVNATITSNGEYLFAGPGGNDILFNMSVPPGGWYMITVEFADETQIYAIFTL